ncbi:plasmid partitioning protein RepB [Chelatococcus asaccharovorans]|uniref:plasmid partitioning protein RepB n=1 Tax=Chelatococcus asaccharovorans TaxID=28210 RepID=UPI00224C6AA8|nr:plasmid partitioning protein RepB [Chelatococcus asaccharovorans]CAH1648097.1 putative replication protein B [Chelatococcus asaccharovorans]CAH1687211.1 putative replication protein B [Chelatococcus asaccharovorans]
MARKNPFASLLNSEDTTSENRAVLDYAAKGATRSLLNSIDEMATQAGKLLEGETIVELDPALIDDSFAKDRFALDSDDYREELERVVAAVRERGQDTPVLVRPHPLQPGRYMLVFGHLRRLSAVKLGRKVRTVIKEMTDREHVIAQGQENNGRANTSFIEKAVFAADIVNRHFDDDNSTVMAALGADKSTLSKMLAVASLPEPLLKGIGRATRIGRDRWYDLKLLLDKPSNLDKALQFITAPAIAALPSDQRFEALAKHLKVTKAETRSKPAPSRTSWRPTDGRLAAETVADGKKFTLALKARGPDARAFGDYLTEHLDRLYAEFRQQDDTRTNGE